MEEIKEFGEDISDLMSSGQSLSLDTSSQEQSLARRSKENANAEVFKVSLELRKSLEIAEQSPNWNSGEAGRGAGPFTPLN